MNLIRCVIIAVSWLFFEAPESAGNAAEQQLRIQVRDGSTLLLDVEQPQFPWVDIEGATSTDRVIRWEDVQELKLVESPVSDQISRIEALLIQLTSADYQSREQAEMLLSDPNTFGPFESQIRDALAARDLESDYRTRRILTNLENYSSPQANQFDELRMKDGTVRTGDATNISIAGQLFEHRVQIDRKNILHVTTSTDSPARREPAPVDVRTFNQAIPEFYRNDQETVVSFEVDRLGQPIPSDLDAGELFSWTGLLLRTPHDGRVITIRYPFKFCPIDAGQKCICPLNESLDKPGRLRGTTVISFCLPGQPRVSAGVHRVGLFLERIEHSRDVVIQAYNARGQMVGMVESTDQTCTFAGFESNELITRVVITKNPHLTELKRNVDETYAIDCVTFDQPMVVREPIQARSQLFAPRATIDFRSGVSLVAKDLKLDGSSVSFTSPFLGQTVQTPQADVHAIGFRTIEHAARDDAEFNMVQLDDSSIIKTAASSWLQPIDFPETEIEPGSAVGVWNANQPARFAETPDFESGRPVIVYPGCRIIAEGLKMKADGFGWDKGRSEKIVQNVQLRDEDDPDAETKEPDLTPQVDQVDFRGKGQLATLWLARPTTTDGRRGHVSLTDGQYFVLGDSGGFQLDAIDSDSVKISLGGRTTDFPLTRVANITFPQATEK